MMVINKGQEVIKVLEVAVHHHLHMEALHHHTMDHQRRQGMIHLHHHMDLDLNIRRSKV